MELPLRDPQDSLPPDATPGRSRAPLYVAVAVGAAAALAAFVVFGPRSGERATPAAAVSAPSAPGEPTQPLGRPAASVTLPPLDQSDPIVRELLGKLSTHPRVAAWLATNELIRNFTHIVAGVADGQAPVSLAGPLRPAGAFRVAERGRDIYMDPRSAARYTPLAQAVASIDPVAAAQLYSTLKPRIEDAYREFGEPRASFDRTLERAIVLLLETPVPPEPFRIEPKGIGYAFADDALEGLAPAQKQLLRMGARNARLIQATLRAVASALGTPAARLP